MIPDPLIGQQLANFRVERLIGRGGMAQVYYGTDVKLNRPVAIKVIDARFQSNPVYAQRFVREAQAIAGWRHENIVQIYYADDHDGLYYFVMEYIDGEDLATLITQYTGQGELIRHDDVLRISRAIARALDYAHSKGVIHRDVKPSNIIVARDGRVVLSDFGLAMNVQHGSRGEVVGTPHYLAPEQAHRSAEAVPQSDLYSFGIILYELLTGSLPFDDPSPTSLALQHLSLPPPSPREFNPDLNLEAEIVLLKALAKLPGERYQTGAELMAELERALASLPAPAPAPRALPLPPAALQGSPIRRASRTTIVEKIALKLDTAPAKPVAARSAQPRSRPPIWVWAFAGLLSFIAVVLIGLVGLVFLNPFNRNPSPTSSAPLGTATAEPVGELLTPVPSEAPAATATATLPPEPAFTLLPATLPPPTQPLAIVPTILYPDGRHFKLFYDEASLYLLNLTNQSDALNGLAFERLDTQGQPTNRFDSWRWTNFYPYVHIGQCVGLEILGSTLARPRQCGDLNSLLTPTRADKTVFWTTRDDSALFRVLINEQEIARCEIGAGVCDMYLP